MCNYVVLSLHCLIMFDSRFAASVSYNPIMNTELQAFLWKEYQDALADPSDIHKHLPILHGLANACSHVTEFGVRSGQSSRALLSSRSQHFRMYDIEEHEKVVQIVNFCQQGGMDVEYHIQDVLGIEIEPTELLFIDTLHTYDQLKAELARHSWKVSRFIAFHDTHTFGLMDEPGYPGPGLLPAILEFLAREPSWSMWYHSVDNNGFTVIKRQWPHLRE